MVVMKVARTIRNHWKKSVFFGVVGSYCVKLLVDKYRISQIMKDFCLEASQFGQESLYQWNPARHITVILNPVARDRKSKSQFESYFVPILNCAGIRVSVVQTETEGQARELMEIMDNTDAVVVAGGSGTLHEAITGLLRRPDQKVIPIGIAPTGKRNLTTFGSLGTSYNDVMRRGRNVGTVEVLARSAMAVVKDTVKQVSVLKIEADGREKPVYAIDGVNIGSIRNTLAVCDGYWYLGSKMKPYLALISQSLFRDWSQLAIPYNVDISYTKPCSGCSRCYTKPIVEVKEQSEVQTNQPRRWWQAFATKAPEPKPKPTEVKTESAVDYSTIDNPECGVWNKYEDNGQIVNLQIKNLIEDEALQIRTHHASGLSKGSFVMDGVHMFNGGPQEAISSVDAQQVRLTMLTEEERQQERQISQGDSAENKDKEDDKSKEKTKDQTKWFWIDYENYEKEDLTITLMRKKLHVYA